MAKILDTTAKMIFESRWGMNGKNWECWSMVEETVDNGVICDLKIEEIH